MIEFRGKTLLCPRVTRHRIRAADIAGHDSGAGQAQLRQRPRQIFNGESTALPIRHGVLGAQAIEIDRDVDVGRAQSLSELRELCPPVRTLNGAPPVLVHARPVICPRMNLQLPSPLRAPVPENIPRPPAFEISAAPNADFLNEAQFEGPVHPAAATPAGWPHIPVRMIIEGNENERLNQTAHPERREMMKIARAVNHERRHPGTELAVKFFDQAARRRKTEARSPPARIQDRQIAGQVAPGIIEV